MKQKMTFAILLALGGTTLAATHVVVEPVVTARQAAMKEMAQAAKELAGIFDGRTDYDAERFRVAAQTLRHRTASITVEFPPGTLGLPSAAKPEIDTSRDEFEALARHIDQLAGALSEQANAAPTDGIPDSMRMRPGMSMGGNSLLRKSSKDIDPSSLPAEHLLHMIMQDCTSCHSRFRQRIN